MGLSFRAEVDARAIGIRREGHLAEMAGLEPFDEILPTDALPEDDVFGRDEDSAIVACATTSAALQTVELALFDARLAHGHRTVTLCGITCTEQSSSSTRTGAIVEPGALRLTPAACKSMKGMT